MIYAWFHGMQANAKTMVDSANSINHFQVLSDVLKETKEHVVFIITKDQMWDFKSAESKYYWEKFRVFTSKPLTNPNYPDKVGNLHLFVYKGQGDADSI